MKKYILTKPLVILLFIVTAGIIAGLFANAAKVRAAEASAQYVFDNAGLLSSSENDEIEKMCSEYASEAGIGIYILTHDDSNAADGITYIENFYDNGNYGDSVFLLIDMYNREVVIEGYGTAETYIHSKRGDTIREEITPYLQNSEYVTAFETYIKDSAVYMKDDSDLNYDHNYSYNNPSGNTGNNYSNDYTGGYNNDYQNHYNYNSSSQSSEVKDILTNVWFQLAVSLIIGGIAVGIMAYNAGGRMTAGGNTYIDSGHSGLIGRQDNYIRTTVTRVRRPQNNNNGRGGFNAGGFGGGVSAGGHSHSTSSGHF